MACHAIVAEPIGMHVVAVQRDHLRGKHYRALETPTFLSAFRAFRHPRISTELSDTHRI